MFRTNFLPKGNIWKDSKTSKYFIHEDGEYLVNGLVRTELGIEWNYVGYGLVKYDTIEDLMVDLYKVAMDRHIKRMHSNITYNKGIKV